jgi:16S rRNA (cytosine967-C5)-methyltransferase
LINVPELWRKRWTKHYGEETAQKIALASLEPAALDIIVKAGADEWAEKLDGKVFSTAGSNDKSYGFRKDHKGIITELDGFKDGAWWVQDFSAHLPCTLFESTPGFGSIEGKQVADLCAAPGGKTAALLTRGADVTAVDISEKRLGRLNENLERLSLRADIKQADILAYEPEQKFNAILLDAPCSATGTIRRHPDILFLKNEALIFELKKLQRKMLEKAISFLKPGGILLYCTCSLEKEEGEAQIDEFLSSYSHVQRVPIDKEEIGGHADWLTKSGDVRLLPFFSPFESNEWPGMDGFFISRLRLSV